MIKAPKKLIEVALPLDEINAEAAREKSIRHGHPSTLHLWWARRPLAAARAVIFAQMVNDPGGERGWSKGLTKEQAAAKRECLFNIIRDLVKWENSNNEDVLRRAREAIWESWCETCAMNKGQPGFDPNKLPAFHDPFAGGGALPLEAQRLGLESYASDLNPVAVMINKAMIEIPPKFAGRKPIGPVPAGELPPDVFKDWPGATGLAEDVRRYGYWMREEAKKRIGHLYPQVEVTKEMAKNRPDLKQYVGKKLTVIAWLWARTVKSPNPAFSDVDVPLIASYILSPKGSGTYVEPVIDGDSYRFSVKVGSLPPSAINGTKAQGRGADFLCLMSGTVITADYIREYGRSHGFGQRMFAVVCNGPKGRIYLPPTPEMEKIAFSEKPKWLPDVPFCSDALGFRIGNYGMLKWSDIYTDRQACALNVFLDLISDVRKDVVARCGNIDERPLFQGGQGGYAYAEAISLYLTMAVSRITHYWSNLSSWHKTGEKMQCVFARQAVSMIWDFAECNVFSESSGNWIGGIDWIAEAIGMFRSSTPGCAQQADAQTQTISDMKVVATDPPYYDNIGYADLSDFFYVWLRKGLRSIFPDLFAVMTTPKEEELVATPCRHGGKKNAAEFFLTEMTKTMRNLSHLAHPAFPVPIFYAFKASDSNAEGTSNTGWETFIGAVLEADFQITGTWPMRTEMSGRARDRGANALASSIVMVCRRRPEDAEVISRVRFLRELHLEMFDALEEMTNAEGIQSSIAAVDLAQAAIGPGMAIFSKYKTVLKSDGSKMSVHEAMIEINREIERYLHPDGQSYDPSTNFFVTWFEQHGYGEGAYGEADVLARAKGTSVDYVVASEVAESKGGRMRILHYSEYPDDKGYDPREDGNLPLWEACHRVIRELEKRNRRAAAELLSKMPNMASDIRQLAYYLFTYCEKHGDAANARAYNALITSWSDIMALMGELSAASDKPVQGELGF